jgi:2,4-didehydro-3-deoxy-L-rhamnonate hydrolase
MPQYLIRYEHNNQPHWGVLFNEKIAPLQTAAVTTGDVIDQQWQNIWSMTAAQAGIAASSVKLLSPITSAQQFICQGVNYASHVRESGLDPAQMPFNTIFTKAGSSLTSADAPVVRPAHVRLLDYEVELGLVVRRAPKAGEQVPTDHLHDYLAGITIVNDLSARDVQLPQGQFYKGKSYRGFGPVGPRIALLSKEEWRRWPQLHMQLSVNGDIRQDAYCGEMIHQPAATLTELAGLQDIFAGDLIATGTPAGCALRAPSKLVMFIVKHFMSEGKKWKMMINKAANNPKYLKPGDRLQLSIATDDGAIDLGKQTTQIVSP